MKYKKGMILKSKGSGIRIKLINRKDGNKHWNTKKLSKGKSHMIHEGTLNKYYMIEIKV